MKPFLHPSSTYSYFLYSNGSINCPSIPEFTIKKEKAKKIISILSTLENSKSKKELNQRLNIETFIYNILRKYEYINATTIFVKEKKQKIYISSKLNHSLNNSLNNSFTLDSPIFLSINASNKSSSFILESKYTDSIDASKITGASFTEAITTLSKLPKKEEGREEIAGAKEKKINYLYPSYLLKQYKDAEEMKKALVHLMFNIYPYFFLHDCFIYTNYTINNECMLPLFIKSMHKSSFMFVFIEQDLFSHSFFHSSTTTTIKTSYNSPFTSFLSSQVTTKKEQSAKQN